ncbi:penicillin acylase family protein [Silicimonas algicola]|uniref:Penicillin amidase n=1 Tax=Silicimonas algicola TaxID=1826607 RepID=A0A316GCD6_9RHOB|nr:penicillin acylase family protein [Silicimonas algicola]AZQ67911.1 penicillin acylase family protein [Silicimonas algicola]PWK57656.1 penicillin amidase [Silicimonas algicola]
MLRLFRWLLRIVTGILALVLLAAVVLYWFFSRSIPEYSGTLTVAGISAPVEIVRDNADVPHIFGATDEDVYFGLGLAHAQDRLWQMTMLRRTAQGRLSEIFGARTAKVDELLRRFDLYALSVKSLEAQDDYTRTALAAYARGVNAWLEEVNTGARGRGAPEFWLFEPSIAPWQPADSIVIGKLMALQLSGHLQTEVLRARVSQMLPDERLADILPDTPGPGVAALPEYASLFDAPLPTYAQVTWPDRLSPVAPRGMAGASNVWAAAPFRSAAGGTLLANDPHLELTAPSIWYLARLELATGGVIGGTIPGAPVVLVGRSENLGWGLTSSYADDQDVFIEKLNPDNPEEVLTPSGWKKMAERTSLITIKDADPITLTLRWTDNGPVLPGSHYDLAAVTPRGHVASLGWTALGPTDTSVQALLGVMRAGTVDEALEAGQAFVAPPQNLTVVDSERIAMKVIGALPRRAARHQTQGRMPAPGWLAENRWQGRLSDASNPEFVDPEGGILGNTNNKVIDRPFPLHMSFDWGDTQRIQRWERLMQSREVHTRESFIEAQLDTVSITARTLLPLVARNLWFTGEAAAEGTPERRRRDALDLLAGWNGEMNEHLPEPLIYMAWMRRLQDRLIRDELGTLADAFPHLEPIFVERVFRNRDGASVWCDVIQSAPEETCTDIARLALDDALVWIDETYGQSLESLRWGDAHEATHDHPVLGDVGWFSWLVNIRQSTSGGDHTLLRGLTSGRDPNPFQNTHGAGYRGVYDFADPDSSVFVISTGQSGHPLSRHYDDLGELWRRGEYIPMTLDPDLARAGAEGITRLEPAE